MIGNDSTTLLSCDKPRLRTGFYYTFSCRDDGFKAYSGPDQETNPTAERDTSQRPIRTCWSVGWRFRVCQLELTPITVDSIQHVTATQEHLSSQLSLPFVLYVLWTGITAIRLAHPYHVGRRSLPCDLFSYSCRCNQILLPGFDSPSYSAWGPVSH